MQTRCLTTALAITVGLTALMAVQPIAEAKKILNGSIETTVHQEDYESVDTSPGIVGLDILIRPYTYPMVKDVFRHSPAHQAGIRPGDTILAINGVTTAGRSSWQVDQAITDIPGEMVSLTIRRRNDVKNIEMQVISLGKVDDAIRAVYIGAPY